MAHFRERTLYLEPLQSRATTIIAGSDGSCMPTANELGALSGPKDRRDRKQASRLTLFLDGARPKTWAQRHGDTRHQTEKAMSYTVPTLLTRNLNDVFGEIDPARRRAAIDEIFHEDAVFYDPNGGIYRGRDEIDGIAGVIKASHPDFRYQPLSPPEEIGNGGRVRWVEGSPGKPPAVAGTDFIIARDGKISAVYLFFDELP